MNDLDFIPPSFHAQQRRRRDLRSQLAWSAGLLVVMGVWFWFHQAQIAQARQRVADTAAQREEMQQRIRFGDQLIAERHRFQGLVRLDDAMDDPASSVVLLAELTALLPDGAALIELSFDARNENGRPVTETLPRLHLVGIAPANALISQFAARLGGSPLLSEVRMGLVRDAEFGKKKVRRFEIDCTCLRQAGGPK